MSTLKSPISILQEIAQSKNIPLPVYDIYPEATGYTCRGFMGTISATASAASKKLAKHLCAEHILETVKSSKEFSFVVYGFTLPASLNLNTPDTGFKSQIIHQTDDPNFNAVGKLNELCSQNCKNFPTYAELGIVNQKFVIECKLLSYTTQGQASTKKRAKQIAAQEMLSRIQPLHLIDEKNTNNDKPKEKPDHYADMDERVVELFKHFSINKSKADDSKYSLLTNKNVPTEKVFVSGKHEGIVNEEELRSILSQMGFLYKIEELQKRPLILVLKTTATKNHPSFTFLHSDSTYKLTVVGLLKKAVNDITFLIS